MKFILLLFSILFFGVQCINTKTKPISKSILLKNGMVYDGSGNAPMHADILINADTIAAIDTTHALHGDEEIDLNGKAVAPGFINMLSWSPVSLIQDGRSMSEIKQGVTFELFGEGGSMGPVNDSLRKEAIKDQGDIKYPIEWSTLKEYLLWLEKKGISCNVASLVGATTVRENVLGSKNIAPNPAQLEEMKKLVKQAMDDGAFGIGTSLIYAPAFYAKTDELIELAKVAAPYGGIFTSHMRSEGNKILEAMDELIRISKASGMPVEIYHLKVGGKQNWYKIDKVIAKIDSARKAGIAITTDMYTYIAGATGLDASMPPEIQEGGIKKWCERLKDPKLRPAIIQAIKTPTDKWENLYVGAGAKGILLLAFKQDSLRYLTGKTLEEAAKIYGKSPEETAMDLVIKDGSRVEVAYFLMSEENVRKQLRLPYMSFCSDAGSEAPEGVFLKSSTHPRAYGNFARLLGKYVREEKIIPLQEAIRKLTSLPASNLNLKKRGQLKSGYFADIVVFDADKIIDKATFDKPQQYAEGMIHVFVNGTQVLKNGEHTGAKSGRAIFKEH